jgi:hypothetical protein
MSNKEIKYQRLYELLKESIDWEQSISIPLSLNRRVNREILGYDLGMMIQNYPSEFKGKLKKDSILYNDYNPKTYFNFGFDINNETTQQYRTDYKILSKILGIATKSLLNWIKNNNPDVVTVFADGLNDREERKKLSIYGSILQGNEQELKNMGYTYSGNMGSNLIVIQKYK